MFKKSIAIILTAVMVLSVSFSAFAAIGDIVGMACHTDIVARVNGYDIPSFNVNGNTYIVAEDLVDYGFNVYWNGDARTLTISRNPYATAITSGYIKPAISPDMVGTKSYDILLTDIATYADSDFIGGYNINGMTIIPFDELARYGNVAWDGVKRRISLTIDGMEIREEPFIPVPINQLANYSSLKRKMSDEEFQQAYNVALELVRPYANFSTEEQLTAVAIELRYMFESGMSYSMETEHYNDPYGYLVLGTASCAGCARATGLCLNILGIPYEHVNENQYSHQWCRVNINGNYWISDAYGMYAGPEPAPYMHPYFN